MTSLRPAPSPSSRRHSRSALLTGLAATALATGGMTLALAPSAGAAPKPAAAAAPAAVSSGTTYTVTNVNSGKCVDARAAATANGTAVQQYTCNGTTAQQWQFTATSGGYFQVGTANAPAQVWDDTGVSSADSSPIQLWLYGGGTNQQWQPVAEASGSYHFVNRFSGKCLDTPAASTADSVQLQQYACNGTAAQSFNLATVGGTPPPPPPGTPDLGPNVLTFDPSESSATIQNAINSVYNTQQSNQFGTQRYALLFKPGTYNVSVPVGYYTQVLGLGQNPTQVTINGGGVYTDAQWNGGNATENFWRGVENLTDAPSSGTVKYAVSQASPMRRVNIPGNIVLDDNGGWSSGGFLGDSRVGGQVNSGSQQQWLSRNDQWGSWTGSNWNMVFVGDQNAPGTSFPNPPYTTIGQTPTGAEKPYLYIDSSGNYDVFVPADETNSSGPTWSSGSNTPGTSLPISQFYIAKTSDTAATLNAALSAGQNLLFTPGVYHLNDTLRITRPDTVVLGLGLATLEADNGVTAMSTADVNGVRIAGLLFDAGTTNSPVLLQVGPTGSSANHSADPTVLSDVFSRIGGAIAGKATVSVQVNSNNVVGDDFWLWRADHGNGGTVGWTTNSAANGLVVNGANVTMYGLAAEHFQQYAVLWNGNGGRTYFLQNELPYDPPNQSSWMDGSTRGYAAYKVANTVTSHQAWGLGVYCYFDVNSSIVADSAIEVPNTSGVSLHDLVTVSLGGVGTISHIVNTSGGPSNSGNSVADLVSYP